MERTYSVRVPASTSNLGPGFDFLGLCIDLELEARIEADATASADRIEYSSDVPWSADEDLALRALDAYREAFGAELPPARLRVHSAIPVGRGFGSSGAAVAATLLLAAAYDGVDVEQRRRQLVDLALAVEGHPDNGTASLLGGCTLAVPHGDRVTVVHQPVHPSLGFAVAWPGSPLFTERARAALPREVPFRDAVENPRRLALLLEGLRTGDPELLSLGVADRLHERHRRALIPGSDAACAAACEAGAFAACLSGAGSGLVAIGPRPALQAVAEALARPLEGGSGRPVEFVPGAPRVEAH